MDHVDGTRLTISWWSTRSWSLEAAGYGNILLMVTSSTADAKGGVGDMEMDSLGFCARPTPQYRAHFLMSVRVAVLTTLQHANICVRPEQVAECKIRNICTTARC